MKTFPGINRLVVAGFRGATSRLEMELSSEQPFVVLFGENGSGKSTLVDAIEFALTGTKGSLSDFKSTSIKHLATTGTDSSPLSVLLEAGGKTWSGRLEGSKPELMGPKARPRIDILRRSRLTKIVAAGPTERFEQLDKFVNCDRIVKSEEGLSVADREAKNRLEEASKTIEESRNSLRELWDEQGRPDGDALTWARKESSLPFDGASGGDSVHRWLTTCQRLLGDLVRAWDNRKDAESNLAASTSSLRSTDFQAGGDSAPDESDLIRILSAARDYFKSQVLVDACPLCQQAVRVGELRAQTDNRLRALQEQIDRLERRSGLQTKIERHQVELNLAESAVSEAGKEISRQTAEPPLSVDGEIVGDLVRVSTAGKGTDFAPGSSIRLTAESLGRRIEEAARAISRGIERRNQVARVWRQHEKALQEGKRLEDEGKRLARCLQLVRRKRLEFVDTLLRDVAGEVNRLYGEIHPGETELGGARFYLDPKQRASLHQVVKFGNQDELPPQACFSESHLLTLGFCLWLALAKRERPQETVIVLDDVVFAIDGPHMKRLAALISVERKHFAQVILTTHSRRFLRYLRDGIAPSGNMDLRTLRWSLSGGIVEGSTPHLAADLESALSNPLIDRQAIASKAGNLLEIILRHFALLYRRRVPFAEPNEPNLAELFDSWTVKEANRVEIQRRSEDQSYSPIGNLGAILTRLRDLRDVRNLVGAHANAEADEVSDAEVQEFGRTVLELWRLVVCSCGQIPQKSKNGAFFCHCRCLSLRPDRVD